MAYAAALGAVAGTSGHASANPAPAGSPTDLTEAPTALPAARKRRLRNKPWFWVMAGVPAIAFLAIMIVLGPVLYQGITAYRDVKVDSVDHQQSAFVPALNAEGTPELVAAPTEETDTEWSGTEPITILLLGVDISINGASRTDTLILVNIDPVAKSAAMLSIPRDLKVVIPGYGIDKINAAFALGEFNKVQGGGAGLTIRTIEANLGIPVSHFAQIDFDGFVKMIDTVGGVSLDVPYPIKDDQYPADNFQYQRVYFPSGWQHLDGEAALQYARTRHQDGDQRRSERQQQVLLALRDQAVNLDLIADLPTLIGQFGDSVRTDIPIDSAISLARLGAEIPRDRITQVSLMPSLYEEQLPDEPYYLIADWTETGRILSDFAGTRIKPPGAALANPEYDLPILILNGTDNEGLAGRVGDVLEWNGFTNVDVALAQDPGSYERSTIVDNGNYLGTSALITNLVGVGADQITVTSLPSSTVTPTARPKTTPTPRARPTRTSRASTIPRTNLDDFDESDYAIVVTLGDDAPDPAEAELQLDEYQDQVDAVEPVTPDTDQTGTQEIDRPVDSTETGVAEPDGPPDPTEPAEDDPGGR